MSELIPRDNMPIEAWWRLWKSGVLFGYGGASAPIEPRPVQAPSSAPPTDYREEIRETIMDAQALAREIAAEHEPSADLQVPTAGLRAGTGVEDIPNGTLYILDLITELMIAFRAFYERFCELDFPMPCSDRYLVSLADRVVRLRLLIVAVRAQEHVDETIDRYIVEYVTKLIP